MAAELARSQFAPPRKRPTLRILLLIAFGALVYLKYDAVIQSPWVQGLRHPGGLVDSLVSRFRTPSQRALPGPVPVAGDSLAWTWTCPSPRSDSCLSAWISLGEEEQGQVRATLARGLLKSGLTSADSFAATFARVPNPDEGMEPPTLSAGMDPAPSGDSATLESAYSAGSSPSGAGPSRLSVLRFSAQGRTFSMRRFLRTAQGPVASPQGSWCLESPAAESGPAAIPDCLFPPQPQPPLSAAAWSLDPARPPTAFFWSASSQAFHPVLPGKVVEIRPGPSGWVKIHHGGLLFSSYSGYGGLRAGLAAGMEVGMADTLGMVSLQGAPESPSPGFDSSAAVPTDPTAAAMQASSTGPAVPTAAAIPAVPSAAAPVVPVAAAAAVASAPGMVVAPVHPAPTKVGLRLGIEKDGSPVDPLAFLGLDAQSMPAKPDAPAEAATGPVTAEVAHGR